MERLVHNRIIELLSLFCLLVFCSNPLSAKPNDTWCLAAAIYHEARGEEDGGKVAVAWVIMNRANKDRTSICNIVYARSQFSKHLKYNTRINFKSKLWNDIYVIAYIIRYSNSKVEDFTDNSTHYHVVNMKNPPRWSKVLEQTLVIGKHVFYKENRNVKVF